MAEYYPLISRAVAGLRQGAPEARRSIYDRARAALVGQLRGMQPPVPEEAINRELAALDEAIARIEGELAPGPTAAEAGPAAVEAALLDTRPAADAATPAKEVPASPPPPSKAPQTSRPAAPLVARRTDPPAPRPSRPVFEPRPSLPGNRPGPAQPAPARPSAVVAVPTPPVPPPGPPVAADPTAEPEKPASLPPAATLEPARPADEPAIDTAADDRTDAAPVIVADRAGGEPARRDEGLRPAVPPRPREAKPGNLRVWIVAAAALVAVVVIALAAWKLRDSPEELAKATPPAAQSVDSTPGKIVERADGGAATDDAGATSDASQPGAAPADAGPQGEAAMQAPAATAPQPAGDQAIPVSYKAAILVAAPDTPERVRTYVGSVVWRSESANQGPDQPLGTAVRADVDVPDAKLQLTMEIRKNTEAQFPASHTIDLKFTVAPDSPIGAVKQVDVPQMRREDAATGEPLIGVPVTITSNYFLVGLTRGEAEARNVEAIKTRGWFDIPMVLADGKPAKITFEKGASGDRIIDDALAAWSRP